MPNLVSLAACMAIATGSLSPTEPNPMSQDESDLTMFELEQEQRDQVDLLALKLPDEAVRKRTRETFGDLKSWLTQRAPMPLSHELKRIRETHEQILLHSKAVEPPEIAGRVLERLLDALPPGMKPDAGQFELVTLERDDWISASGGQNLLYISTGAVAKIGGDAGADDRLAFFLARQIAASCLGHCRSWYQAEWAAAFVRTKETEEAVARITSDDFSGTILDRQASTAETFGEDLFAVHLCRLAGFDIASSLDVVRQEVLELAADLPDEPESIGDTRGPLRRLRSLRMELDGIVTEEKCGLHRFDEGHWQAIGNGELANVGRAVVLLHGLGSSKEAFADMLRSLEPDLPDEIAIIGFTYPDTGSLYRSSGFLLRELNGVSADSSQFDFVCHSAGGLVFRRAAEQNSLPFRTATLIGTPSRGSDLASLRPLLEAQEFFGSLRGGFSESVANVAENDSAQMVRDLEPRSLFLTELNAAAPPTVRSRYNIVRGQALSTRKALLLALGVGTARAALRKMSESALEGGRQESAGSWISRLRVPEEVRSGDMAVTLASATTPDAAEVLTVSTAHTKLPEDPQVIEFVRRTIVGK